MPKNHLFALGIHEAEQVRILTPFMIVENTDRTVGRIKIRDIIHLRA